MGFRSLRRAETKALEYSLPSYKDQRECGHSPRKDQDECAIGYY